MKERNEWGEKGRGFTHCVLRSVAFLFFLVAALPRRALFGVKNIKTAVLFCRKIETP
jgi:hypothetical protein